MSRKHRRNMQHRVFENSLDKQIEEEIIESANELYEFVEDKEEIVTKEPVVEFSHGDIAVPMAEEPIVAEPIIEKPISQYNDKDFVVVENEGQVFPVKYARAKAMGYKVLRKL
jgi:hypothetical protein